MAVATTLDRFAGADGPTLDNLWVSEDLSMNIRYRIGADLMAVRVERLDVDPTSACKPVDSTQLASNLLHTLHSPSEPDWVDEDGYVWWGDRPANGWSTLSKVNAVVIR